MATKLPSEPPTAANDASIVPSAADIVDLCYTNPDHPSKRLQSGQASAGASTPSLQADFGTEASNTDSSPRPIGAQNLREVGKEQEQEQEPKQGMGGMEWPAVETVRDNEQWEMSGRCKETQ
ncbi:uncharacterized protein CLAFUR5_14651 [Fulvia fulva]|uniref:Uncharacterized protein n=1 Tax=Passalora fulva TaxID=5499 RepID=A0A9Q8UX52_PASFU|nr:uncharacterized protein CLAFUR5_14651 [Fulvia fulva]KAK4608902.1 hypothetical protein CLAFUR0_14862 [Fulvia fulva]UJO25422.1 hypothetical protein CLAFUR5_14651 [Fulvia fulva]